MNQFLNIFTSLVKAFKIYLRIIETSHDLILFLYTQYICFDELQYFDKYKIVEQRYYFFDLTVVLTV